MPADNDTAGLAASTEIVGKYVGGVLVEDGEITVTFSSDPGDAHATLDTNSIVLRPITTNPGAVAWECTGDGIENKHLPASCRS